MTFSSWLPKLLLWSVAGSLLVLICIYGERSEACGENSSAPTLIFIINEKEVESRGDELYPGFDICMERADGRTFTMKDCYSEGVEYWESELNIIF